MPENTAIQTADKIMSAVIRDVAAQAAIKLAQAEFPFLALPIVSNIFTLLVGKISNWIYISLENFVAFKIIDSQVSKELEAYKNAIAALQTAVKINEGVDDAREKYKNELKKLIHYDGHA